MIPEKSTQFHIFLNFLKTFYISFNSALIFIISFLLLSFGLGLLYSLRCKIKLFEAFPLFKLLVFIEIIFFLVLFFVIVVVSYNIWWIMFLCLKAFYNFFFDFFFDSLVVQSVVFNFHIFVNFWTSPLLLILVSFHCSCKRYLIWFQSSWICRGFFCDWFWRMFCVFWEYEFCYCRMKCFNVPVRSIWSIVLLKSSVSLLIFSLTDVFIIDGGRGWNLPLLLHCSVLWFNFVNICFICLWYLILDVCVCVAFLWMDPFIIKVHCLFVCFLQPLPVLF